MRNTDSGFGNGKGSISYFMRAASSTRCVAVLMCGETCNDCMADESCHDWSDLLAARAAMIYNERGNCLNLEGVSALDTDEYKKIV